MRRKWLSLIVAACLLAPFPVKAEVSTVESFVQSIVSLYVAAEMCKDIKTLHSENYAVLIKSYLSAYFKTDIPYWVLPEVTRHIKDRENCVFAIEQRLVNYQHESANYAADFPGQPAPPPLEDYMLVDSRSYTLVANNNSNADHYITPSVVAQ